MVQESGLPQSIKGVQGKERCRAAKKDAVQQKKGMAPHGVVRKRRMAAPPAAMVDGAAATSARAAGRRDRRCVADAQRALAG